MNIQISSTFLVGTLRTRENNIKVALTEMGCRDWRWAELA
jgi:hypothetical protein